MTVRLFTAVVSGPELPGVGWLTDAVRGIASAVGWVASHLLGLGLIALGLAVVWAAAVAWSTRRTLASRRQLVMLPTEVFDPKPEHVARFALQLMRVRRAVHGGLDRRGRAVRVRLDAAGDGQMLYSVEVPEAAVPVVQSALYSQVELRHLDALHHSGLAAVATGPGPDSATAGDSAVPGARESGGDQTPSEL